MDVPSEIIHSVSADPFCIFIPVHGFEDILYEPVLITYHADSLQGHLPPDALKKYLELYTLAHQDPAAAQTHVEQMQQLFPNIPAMANLLCYCLLKRKKFQEAEEQIQRTYLAYPDYLFAKINYADQCLRNHHPDKIPEIFKNQFSLSAICPGRSAFHYSEFRGFAVVMAHYFLTLKQEQKAETFYHLAMKVDPLHHSVRYLEKKLFHLSWAKKAYKTLLAFLQSFKLTKLNYFDCS